MTRKIFGRGADRHAALEDLQADICPLADGFKVDATVNEGLSEVAPSGAEGVCPDRHGAGNLISLEELDCLTRMFSFRAFTRVDGTYLCNGEQLEELLSEEVVIAVVAGNVGDELLHIFRS